MSVVRKITLYVLIFVLILPIFYAGNVKKTKADTQIGSTGGNYPPADFGVNWSTYTEEGKAKVNFYWKKPTKNVLEYTDPYGIKIYESDLQWVLNFYDTGVTPENKIDTWQDGYNVLTDSYINEVHWGGSYRAQLDLRWTYSAANPQTMGWAKISFKLPDTPTTINGQTGTGDCPVQELKAIPENYAFDDPSQKAVHFSWKYNTKPGCEEYKGVIIQRPDGSGMNDYGGYENGITTTDKTAQAGNYTFKTVKKWDDWVQNHEGAVHGVNTVNVSFPTNGTSITNPGTGSDTGGTTAKDETCGFKGSWVATRIAEVICAFIQGIGGMSQWIIDTLFTGTFNA